MCVCVYGGYSDIFLYTYSDHFLGFKILNFNDFWGFQKNECFLGYEDFVDIFGVSQKWTGFRGRFFKFQLFFF